MPKAWAQKTNVVAQFIVNKATVKKGYDNSKDIIDKKTTLAFYTVDGNDNIYFLINFGGVKSYGPAENMIRKNIDKTDKLDRADVYMFKWMYKSWDGNSEVSQAYIQLVKTYSLNGTTFWCKMVSDGRELIMEGIMEAPKEK